MIGSLMYLASATRPGISFAVSKLSRFMSNPGTDHWHALERVMCCLVGTMSYGIHYSGHPTVLEGYSDSNWISDADELYATSGYVFTLGDGAISWRYCKQTILTWSTMKAELADAVTCLPVYPDTSERPGCRSKPRPAPAKPGSRAVPLPDHRTGEDGWIDGCGRAFG